MELTSESTSSPSPEEYPRAGLNVVRQTLSVEMDLIGASDRANQIGADDSREHGDESDDADEYPQPHQAIHIHGGGCHSSSNGSADANAVHSQYARPLGGWSSDGDAGQYADFEQQREANVSVGGRH